MPPWGQPVNEDLPPHSVDRMPTLTEVLEFELEPPAGDAGGDASVHGEVSAHTIDACAEAATEPAPEPVLDSHALINEVLAELQPRIDMLFESRMREALAPALARAAEGLIRDARGELGSALHELVEGAVTRALQRRGGRWP